jgi:hypothetical protein
MSLEFAIIPCTPAFLSDAHDIQTKLKEKIKLVISIIIDTNYNTPYNTRISKWKKLEHNVITIDHEYNESQTIFVRFSDKGSRPHVTELDEFIELVNSFEENEVDTDDSEDEVERYVKPIVGEIKDKDRGVKDVDEDICCIM